MLGVTKALVSVGQHTHMLCLKRDIMLPVDPMPIKEYTISAVGNGMFGDSRREKLHN